MTVFVVYSKQDQNYGSPFKVFGNKDDLEKWLITNKDDSGCEFCWDEMEVE